MTVIANPKKLVRDMVEGHTIEEAVNQVPKQVATTVTGVDNSILEQFIGDPVLVFTTTFAMAGRLAQVAGTLLLLEETVWIPDLGKPSVTLRDLSFTDVEEYKCNSVLAINQIIYMVPLPDLPKAKKK